MVVDDRRTGRSLGRVLPLIRKVDGEVVNDEFAARNGSGQQYRGERKRCDDCVQTESLSLHSEATRRSTSMNRPDNLSFGGNCAAGIPGSPPEESANKTHCDRAGTVLCWKHKFVRLAGIRSSRLKSRFRTAVTATGHGSSAVLKSPRRRTAGADEFWTPAA